MMHPAIIYAGIKAVKSLLFNQQDEKPRENTLSLLSLFNHRVNERTKT